MAHGSGILRGMAWRGPAACLRCCQNPKKKGGDTDNVESAPQQQSRYLCKTKLGQLCESVATNKHEQAFRSLGKFVGVANTLDLSFEGMKAVQEKVPEIYTVYMKEFPVAPSLSMSLPNAVVAAGVYTPAASGNVGSDGGDSMVRVSSTIESEQEYNAKLSDFMNQCRQAELTSIDDYINQRVTLVISNHGSGKIIPKLEKVGFMSEPGSKLFIYDSFCRDPADWAKIRKNKRSLYTSARVLMTCDAAGDESTDTLACMKAVYQHFKTSGDGLSDDIVACIIPAAPGDNPTNESLQLAWRSLKSFGSTYIGPKVGSIRVASTEMLQHVYSRGAWNTIPNHHLLFTYQSRKGNSMVRKRMKYLKDGIVAGDTYFNAWPIPMWPIPNMPKATAKLHDEIFTDDLAMDSGEEDGAGAALVSDLGDHMVPFPRELHYKLTQEMIHVWDIDVGVIFHTGAGQSLLGFILENKRAVGIVKNKDHKTFVMKFLQEAVKTHNLIPPCSVIKSPALLEWERAHVGNSMAAPRQAAMKQPLVEHVSMPLLVGPPAAAPMIKIPTATMTTAQSPSLAAFGASVLR